MDLSTTSREKDYLAARVAELGARRVLEIGAFQGATTCVLSASVPPGGYVAVIDPMTWAAEIGSNALARHLPRALHGLCETVAARLGAPGYEDAFWARVESSGRGNVHLFRGLSAKPGHYSIQQNAQQRGPLRLRGRRCS